MCLKLTVCSSSYPMNCTIPLTVLPDVLIYAVMTVLLSTELCLQALEAPNTCRFVRYEKMAGSTLVPPLGSGSRVEQLGPLLPALLRVEGQDWKGSSTDVAIAGDIASPAGTNVRWHLFANASTTSIQRARSTIYLLIRGNWLQCCDIGSCQSTNSWRGVLCTWQR